MARGDAYGLNLLTVHVQTCTDCHAQLAEIFECIARAARVAG